MVSRWYHWYEFSCIDERIKFLFCFSPLFFPIGTHCNYQITNNDKAWNEYIKKGQIWLLIPMNVVCTLSTCYSLCRWWFHWIWWIQISKKSWYQIMAWTTTTTTFFIIESIVWIEWNERTIDSSCFSTNNIKTKFRWRTTATKNGYCSTSPSFGRNGCY